MSQRFTLDRSSFEQVLCATSLMQQLNRQALHGAQNRDQTQALSNLAETQLAIETETLNLEAAMNRVVGLALKLSPATGAAIWLFNGQELVYRTGAGHGTNDERLQLQVLAKLASISGPTGRSLHDPRASAGCSPASDAIHYPGSVKSLLVAPIYQGRDIAGALAAFSMEFNAFTERDATRARLLSGLLTQALSKAAEAELKQRLSLERAALLQAIDRLIPALRELVEKEQQEPRSSPGNVSSLLTEPETGTGSAGVQTPPLPAAIASGRGDHLRVLEPVPAREATQAPEPESLAATRIIEVQPTAAKNRNAFHFRIGPVIGQLGERASAFVSVRLSLASEKLREACSFASSATRNAGAHLRSSRRHISDLLARTELTHRLLSRVEAWWATTMDGTRKGLLSISSYRMHIRIPASVKWRRVTLSTAAATAAVVLTILAFPFLRTTGGDPSKAAAKIPQPSSPAKLKPTKSGTSGAHPRAVRDASHRVTASEPSQLLAQGSDLVSPLRLSHRQVTDPVMSSALQALSRYEIAALRRRAKYGDDSAALLLGLAYETGYLVPQNCTKAAAWVTRSAEDGNAAAQYNLGLRYRDGDGVPVDQEGAVKWLTKSSAQKYSAARMTLKSAP
jgi:Sel1 repeat